MRVTKSRVVLVVLVMGFLFSFRNMTTPAQRVAQYYDDQLDSLLVAAMQMKVVCGDTVSAKVALLNSFFACRNAYKKVELFVDVFDAYKAQQLNGPDLLKIEEENPRDSMVPHGLQVMESILYTEVLNRDELREEVGRFIKCLQQMRGDADRVYYFRNDRVWHAMRMAVYRVSSLGVTGFDVPLSNHALPETRCVLDAVLHVAGCYHKEIGDTSFNKGRNLLKAADAYLLAHSDFNSFDRLTFIRDHVNPISAWLMQCAKRLKYINYDQRLPLNQDAPNLFSANIMNLSFFANSRYGVTAERVALGKQLFYDVSLSGDGGRSCASCHKPELGFTDGLAVPMDMTGSKPLRRNTPTLWNAGLQTRQFYDLRTETLENQLSAVVHNSDEMNGSLKQSAVKLQADKVYVDLFKKAYAGDKDQITEYNIANAISCYVRSLVSLNSRFDKYMRREAVPYSTAERNGFNLFMGKAKCGTCHFAPLFGGLLPPLYEEMETEILGVPAADSAGAPLDSDPGKSGFTRVPAHQYAFKTSTVRNAALTGPYMHNGVFRTLDDVVRFYNDGGGAGMGIEVPTQTLPVDKLGLTKKEMKDIVAFMHTLTDTSGSSFSKVLGR